MRRRRLNPRWWLTVGMWLAVVSASTLPGPPPARADEPAQVTSISPTVTGNLVVCRLITGGLPGEKLLQSMRSGLVSEVAFDLVLLDEKKRVVAGNRVSLQLTFDLWEEVFAVRTGDQEQRFAELTELVSYLRQLDDVPVAPLNLLAAEARYRVRVGLHMHPIAPEQESRVEDVIAGDQRPRRVGEDQQEATISLGRLIRLFYKGGGSGGADSELFSSWFRREDLGDAVQ